MADRLITTWDLGHKGESFVLVPLVKNNTLHLALLHTTA
jgi:hypothetical protein